MEAEVKDLVDPVLFQVRKLQSHVVAAGQHATSPSGSSVIQFNGGRVQSFDSPQERWVDWLLHVGRTLEKLFAEEP